MSSKESLSQNTVEVAYVEKLNQTRLKLEWEHGLIQESFRQFQFLSPCSCPLTQSPYQFPLTSPITQSPYPVPVLSGPKRYTRRTLKKSVTHSNTSKARVGIWIYALAI